MSQAFGHNAWIGFAEESTFNTPVTPATKFVEILDESFAFKSNYIQKPSLRGVSHINKVPSKKAVEGGFKMQGIYAGMERLFKHALGANETLGAGPYTHDITPSFSDLPTGLTFYVNRDAGNIGGSSLFQYSGCQINKLTLSQKIEDFLTCEFEVLGANRALVAAQAATFPTFQGIQWNQLSTFTLNGVNVKVEDFELTVENNLNSDRYELKSLVRKGFGRTAPRKISGKIVCEFDSLVEYNYFANLTSLALVALWEIDANTSFQITIPVAYLTGEDPNAKDHGALKLTLPFDVYATAASNEMTVRFENSSATI